MKLAKAIGHGSATETQVRQYVPTLRKMVDHMWDEPGAGNCPGGDCPTPPSKRNSSVPGTH